MAYIADMIHCSYFALEEGADCLLAVGWLEGDQEFRKGSVPESFYLRLKELLQDPWQPFVMCGTHECSLCQFDGIQGVANLFIPHDGRILVAPELILHYVGCHHYQPPGEFIDAVMECPDIRSMEYKRKLFENGGKVLLK